MTDCNLIVELDFMGQSNSLSISELRPLPSQIYSPKMTLMWDLYVLGGVSPVRNDEGLSTAVLGCFPKLSFGYGDWHRREIDW